MQFVLDKGQEDDWFGNPEIRWAFVVMVVGFGLFMARELLASKPLVDLRALTNRNLAIGSVGVFVLGTAIYSLTTTLPVFYQTLMGYTATAAGVTVSPRGLGSIVASVLAGVVLSKIDPRPVVSLGFAVLAFSTWSMGQITLGISPATLFWAITLGGFGITLVFIPLSTVAFGTMSKNEVGNASGIFNFLRNIGGSIGISAVNTISQRHLQTHRNENVHWLSGASWILRRQIGLLTERMQMHAGPRVSTLRAFSLTQKAIDQQSQLWAYVDDFRYLVLVCVACVPLAFLLKKPSKDAKGAA
jgi:DHA2 family multidrug resistance protein